MKNTRKEKFDKDNDWGTYFEFELNNFIEPYFNRNLYKFDKFISFTTLRSSDIFKSSKDWYKFDTLYNIYKKNDIVPCGQLTFEIKTDRFDKTGNVCIEKKCSNKESGVFHTEADYFIYFMPRYQKDNLYIFKPKVLSEFLENNYNSHLLYGGDDNKALNYIIDKNEFDNRVLNEKLGKIETYNCVIPEKFGVKKFEDDNKVVYTSDSIKVYDDLF